MRGIITNLSNSKINKIKNKMNAIIIRIVELPTSAANAPVGKEMPGGCVKLIEVVVGNNKQSSGQFV
jgi:hypothetical protein